MKKIFLLTLLLVIVFISCKRTETESIKPKTFEELKSIIRIDENIVNYVDATQNILSTLNETSLSNKQKNNTFTVPYSEAVKLIRNAKNKDELVQVLKGIGLKNSEVLINYAEIQMNNIILFIKKYPEFLSLTNEQKKSLINNVDLGNSNLNNLNSGFSLSSSKLMSLKINKNLLFADACLTSYNVSIRTCDIGYGVALTAIWLDTALGAGPTLGSSILGGLIASGIAMIAYDACYDLAAVSLSNCGGIESIDNPTDTITVDTP